MTDGSLGFEDALDVLAELWEQWAQVGKRLDEQSWGQPTRLPEWDVRALFAHHSIFPAALSGLAGRPVETEPMWRSASSLLQAFNQPGGLANTAASSVAQHAVREAAVTATDVLVNRFETGGPAAIQECRRVGQIVVDYFGQGTLGLVDALTIGILEATVHLLDLARAVAKPPAVPTGALAATMYLLLDMTSPIDFIEAATGRSATPIFPVLR